VRAGVEGAGVVDAGVVGAGVVGAVHVEPHTGRFHITENNIHDGEDEVIQDERNARNWNNSNS